MKKILTTALAFASIVFGCAAPSAEETSDVTQNEMISGPGIWQLKNECGTKEKGKCSKDVDACAADVAIGGECPNGGARCLSAPIQSGLRQVLFCNPTSNSTWAYNGDCANNDCSGRPDCDKNDNDGARCHYPLKRCGKNGRVLVCLTNGKDQYVFSGYCGKNGGPSCDAFAACPKDEDGMAGLACGELGATCQRKIDKLSGKVFTCVTR